MRRRPEEDDQEEPERRQAEVPGGGGVADERRYRAGGAADDDVLRRRALQPARVDEHVEEVPDESERGGQDVDGAREQDEGERREDEPELERARRRHAARGDRALLRPLAHQPVDVRVEHVVERAGAAAREREADHRGDEEVERGSALRADEHPGRARDEQQGHDPRLRQRHVVPPRPGRDGFAAEALRRGEGGSGERARGEGDVEAVRRHRGGGAEESQREQRGPEQPAVGGPAGDREGDERWNRQRRDLLVADADRAGDDREQRSRHARERGELQPGTRPRAHGAPSAVRRRS